MWILKCDWAEEICPATCKRLNYNAARAHRRTCLCFLFKLIWLPIIFIGGQR